MLSVSKKVGRWNRSLWRRLSESEGSQRFSEGRAIRLSRRTCMATLAVATMLSGCSTAIGSTSPATKTSTGPRATVGAEASCAAMIEFRGGTYIGNTLNAHPSPARQTVGMIPLGHMHRIGVATTPPCNDTGGTGTSRTDGQQVVVAKIDHVNSSVAVAVLATGAVYVRRGARVPASLAKAPWIHWVTP